MNRRQRKQIAFYDYLIGFQDIHIFSDNRRAKPSKIIHWNLVAEGRVKQNESLSLQDSCERYRERHGYNPERILRNKIYRTRDNLNYCAAYGFSLNGSKLGRQSKDLTLLREQKRQERLDADERNVIESKFGETKRHFSLNRIFTRQMGANEATIVVFVRVMNLKKDSTRSYIHLHTSTVSKTARSHFRAFR